jgi:hypothetical protein
MRCLQHIYGERAFGGQAPGESDPEKNKDGLGPLHKEIAEQYEHAEKITLVMDNLNTHKAGSLYEAFAPKEAKGIWDRFEFVYAPTHGSWLNMAEIELNVLIRQCLNRRIENISEVRSQASAWETHRNNLDAKVNWQFTTEKARVKLRRLYPTLVA